VPGVSLVSSVALLFALPELGRLNRGEIAALVGAAPFNDDSGTLSGQRKIQGGRRRLRRILYLAESGLFVPGTNVTPGENGCTRSKPFVIHKRGS
jgi:transposase